MDCWSWNEDVDPGINGVITFVHGVIQTGFSKSPVSELRALDVSMMCNASLTLLSWFDSWSIISDFSHAVECGGSVSAIPFLGSAFLTALLYSILFASLFSLFPQCKELHSHRMEFYRQRPVCFPDLCLVWYVLWRVGQEVNAVFNLRHTIVTFSPSPLMYGKTRVFCSMSLFSTGLGLVFIITLTVLWRNQQQIHPLISVLWESFFIQIFSPLLFRQLMSPVLVLG